MTVLAINWSSVGLQVAQLLLSLSILVILHEFGHYITARNFISFLIPGFLSSKKSMAIQNMGSDGCRWVVM
jgi:hypothetical protein